ncbi:MAG: branched-chain amino acid ABC transporter permease [Paracoccus sp. (in: a-proteobacteria)]|uniref:branched-chain amino acid ABC transporter permease n=1 Tax=Paracoccus sp. TaxID=267 RepID=UPI0039E23A15
MITVIWSGLAVGAIYALIALCYNLSYVTSGVLNFAVAHLVVLGGFVGWWLIEGLGLPLAVAIVICGLVGAAVGLIEERIAIAPLRVINERTGGGHGYGELISTIGFATVITGISFIIWGGDARELTLFANDTRMNILGGGVLRKDLLLIATAIAVAVGIWLWTKYSRSGIACAAQTEDRDAAMLHGINVRRLSYVGFAAVGGLCAVLGPVVGAKTLLVVAAALVLAIKGFVALTLGGVGSCFGVLLAGFALGIAEAATARWLGPEYRNLVVFALFLIFLLARPGGMAAKGGRRTI